jgi:hypothetical protein
MNKKPAARTVIVEVLTRRYDGLGSMTCESCQGALDLIQPDPMRTDRFLATCSQCGNWWLVHHRDNTTTVQFISLEPVAIEIVRSKSRHSAES